MVRRRECMTLFQHSKRGYEGNQKEREGERGRDK
jgi:hypothetical protein